MGWFTDLTLLTMLAVTLHGVRIPLAALVLEYIRMLSKSRKVSVPELYSCLSRCPHLCWELNAHMLSECKKDCQCSFGSSEAHAICNHVGFKIEVWEKLCKSTL